MSDTIILPDAPEELVFCAEELPVLTGRITLPHRQGRNGRFNRYYRSCADAFERCCRRELLPRAESAYYRALENAGPLPQWRAELTCRVTLQTERLLSLRSDTTVTGMGRPTAARRGDTWDLRRELLVSLPDCFAPRVPWKKQLLQHAAQQIQDLEAQGIARYHDGWQHLLSRAFRPQDFYLTDEGLCFFFPLGSIAPEVEGLPTFCLPYSEETGPFIPQV